MTDGEPSFENRTQTGQLAANDPSVTSFEATVTAVDGRYLALDRTYFYAESGGQPADRGTIDGVDVVDVKTGSDLDTSLDIDPDTVGDERIVHVLETAPNLEPGDVVTGRVDDSFRTYCMRAHTASHVVYGAGRRLLSDVSYGGFDIGPDKVRIDFQTTDDLVDVDPIEFEKLAAEVVWESREVSWRDEPLEWATAQNDVVFNLPAKTLESAETVRIVEIDGWDVAACGGTHVRNTAEIGPIHVVDSSNPGADLLRIEFRVGPAAIEDQIREKRTLRRAASKLGTNVDELVPRIDDLEQEVDELTEERDILAAERVDATIESLRDETFTRDDRTWLVGSVDGASANDLAERVPNVTGKVADVVVFVGKSESTFAVVGSSGEPTAADLVEDLTTEFGGGGGGSPTIAQCGGLDTDPEAVVDYLRP